MRRIGPTALVVEPCTARICPPIVYRRLGGLHRQRFDFRGDDSEAAACIAGARRFYRGVEREQIGLLGNGLNELDDIADLLCRIGERSHLAVS